MEGLGEYVTLRSSETIQKGFITQKEKKLTWILEE